MSKGRGDIFFIVTFVKICLVKVNLKTMNSFVISEWSNCFVSGHDTCKRHRECYLVHGVVFKKSKDRLAGCFLTPRNNTWPVLWEPPYHAGEKQAIMSPRKCFDVAFLN